MAEISIGDNHKPYLTRIQHLGEYLNTERARIENEYRCVMGQLQRLDSEFTTFLEQSYHLEPHHMPVTLDTERGVIVTADNEDKEPAESPSE